METIELKVPPATIQPFAFSSPNGDKISDVIEAALKLLRSDEARMITHSYPPVRIWNGNRYGLGNVMLRQSSIGDGATEVRIMICPTIALYAKIYSANTQIVVHDKQSLKWTDYIIDAAARLTERAQARTAALSTRERCKST